MTEKELSQPVYRTIDVEAFDEQTARGQAKVAMSSMETIVEIRLKTPGKKGILGLGKKPNVYKVEVLCWDSLLEIIMSDCDATEYRSQAYKLLRESFSIADEEASPGVGIRVRPEEMNHYKYCQEELEFAKSASMLPGAVYQCAELRLLADAIAHPEIENRVAAVRALGDLRSRAAVPILSLMLLDWLHYESYTDSGDSLRGPAAEALAKIANPGTMPLLIASIELDRLNIYPEIVIARGESIRSGIMLAGTDFAKEVLELHDRGEIDRTLVRDLLVAASDEARYSKFIPVVDHRSGGQALEKGSFLFMVKQANALLASLKSDDERT